MPASSSDLESAGRRSAEESVDAWGLAATRDSPSAINHAGALATGGSVGAHYSSEANPFGRIPPHWAWLRPLPLAAPCLNKLIERCLRRFGRRVAPRAILDIARAGHTAKAPYQIFQFL